MRSQATKFLLYNLAQGHCGPEGADIYLMKRSIPITATIDNVKL